MKEEFEHIEDIERYCEGMMGAEEKEAFKTRLLLDTDLQEELDLYRILVEGLRHSSESNDIRHKFKAIDQELDQGKVLPRRKQNCFFRFVSIAASISIALLISYYYFTGVKKAELISSFEVTEVGLPVLMGESSNVAFDESMNAYKVGDFKRAMHLILPVLQKSPSNDTLNYFTGIFYSRLKDENKAVTYFNNVSDSNSVFFVKAAYESGLCYWRISDLIKSENKFSIVTNLNAGAYSINSAEILSILKKERQ